MKPPRSAESIIKLFAMSNQLLENDLDRIERLHGIDLGRPHKHPPDADETYYPQFELAVREEAAAMAKHYEIFYCLEKTIRGFIADVLASSEGTTWWDSARIPAAIKTEVSKRIQKEIDAAVTVRSEAPIDFTTFGELGEIIKANWDLFGGMFSSQAAVTKVMANLNTLRGPIAHCSPLGEDEVLRLQLSVRDWFRLME